MAPNINLVVSDFDDENYLALIAIFRDCVLYAEVFRTKLVNAIFE